MKIRRNSLRFFYCALFVLTLSAALRAAMVLGPFDPGVRGGPAAAGAAISGLTTKENKFFQMGLDAFSEVQSTRGTIADTEPGLGPRFNLNSCIGCHAQPAAGGTIPGINPQVAVATRDGATNIVPSFITLNGPIREARFKYVDPPANTIRDGGVHDLYTPDFTRAVALDNLSFRIPTPVFGAGLIQGIPDSAILANVKNSPVMGVSGRPNREGNAETISRFGWKAQNKSLVIFSGEAYNVEQGVTNEVFPQERDETPGCTYGSYPEDVTNFEETQPQKISSDVINFANFMSFLAPPTPVTSYSSSVVGNVTPTSIQNGKTQFGNVGCNLCHTPSMQTGVSATAALSGKTANLYSDLLLHHMGGGLADDIIQGAAGPDDFRTARCGG